MRTLIQNAVLSLVAIMAMMSAATGGWAAERKPNFVFVYSDDHRWDAMGVVQKEQGERARFPWIKTPHMDRLAGSGVRFRNSFVTMSLCAPSRAAFLTGRYNHANGITNNSKPFPADAVSHATLLRAAGYKTAYVGKWHMGDQKGPRPGFDYSASFVGQGRYNDCPFEVDGKPAPTRGRVDTVSTDYAIEWMKRNRDLPFSVVIGLKGVHSPRGGSNLPEPLRSMYAGETSRPTPNCGVPAVFHQKDAKTNQFPTGLASNAVHLDYMRHVADVDAQIGRLLDAIDELKLSDDTVFIYASDNGYFLGEHNSGDKRSLYDESLRIPFAREGTRFTDAHSSSGVCTPSRYALLEGRYHWRKFHGIVNSFDQPVLDDEKLTMAELLKAKGYQTACIGKWHLGWDWNAIKSARAKAKGKDGFAPDAFDWTKPIPGGPLSHGFDYYFGDDVPNFPPYAWFENDRVITTPTVSLTTTAATAEGQWEARPGPAVKDWDFWAVMPELTRKAEQWIGRQRKDQPFFLYFPFTSPHAPIVPTKEFVGKSQSGGYGDFVVQTDDTVGRVLAALEKHGFAENTLVIFSADNGPERYAYDRVKNSDHRSMGPLRGLKRDIWEGGHRVPFVVRWPGTVPAGKVSDGLISQIDIYATVAAIVGAEIPAGSAEDSYNQIALFKGTSPTARDTLVHNTNPQGYALRHGDWVLIDAKTGGVSAVPAWFDEANGYTKNSQPGELYNLKEDVAQKKNLFAEQPEKVAELKAVLSKLRNKGQVR